MVLAPELTNLTLEGNLAEEIHSWNFKFYQRKLP